MTLRIKKIIIKYCGYYSLFKMITNDILPIKKKVKCLQ